MAAIGLCLLGGCRERAPAEQIADQAPAEAVAKPRIEVGVSGCAGLVQDAERGLVCLTRKLKPLHLWLDGASDPEVELQFDGVAIEATRTIDPDGVLVSVELPKREGRLELETPDGVWAAELVAVSDRFEVLRTEVQASWRSGDAVAARERFERALTELEQHEAELLRCAAAQVILVSGDHDRALTLANEVTASPVVSCVGKAALLTAYVQIYLRPDFNAAERSLHISDSVHSIDFDTRIGSTYLQGVLEHQMGQLDESLLAFERSARWARLVGDDGQHASAMVMQAVALARLGRFAEAEALANEVEKQAAELEQVKLALDVRSSIGWISVLRREEDPSLADPSAGLRELVAAYETSNDRRNLSNRRLDLALALVQNADLEGAEAELEALDPGDLDPDLLVWFELTNARIQQMHGSFDRAAAHIERARVLAELNQDRELDWWVEIGWGELEQARGNHESAIASFRAAIQIADALALSITGNAGRSRFVTTHSRADIALIELLLERGDNEAAMCTAMAARARHLRGLWARLRPPLSEEAGRHYRDLLSRHQERKQAIAARLERSWELSTDELESLRKQVEAEGARADHLLAEATSMLEEGAPTWSCERALPQRPGDAVLTMAPRTNRNQWTAMLARREAGGALDIETMTLGSVVDADMILEHFTPTLEGIQNLRVIPVGAFVAVNFHRLWLARGKLEPTISYSLGLGSVADRGTVEPRASVVAGASDLAAASKEAAAVAERLGTLGWLVERRWAPSAESQPSLLHYAGHGVGQDELGWQSALELPELGRISAAQIVARQRSPEMVVLGACSAGRVASDSIDGGMNLAAAFLLAGARVVIAPTHDVEDAAALALGVGLYQQLDEADPEGLARALARIQLEQLASEPMKMDAASYASWRAWTP